MQITLNLRKTLEQNANDYFARAKKFKKKVEGATKIIAQFQLKLAALEQKQQHEEKQVTTKKVERKQEWFEKFRWFISSEGFLCIGGRDATSNEVVIKKHTETDDIVFHTELPSSPFFVIKTDGKKPGEATLQETANATALFSKAWKMGLGAAEVFLITPAQVSKKTVSGEYMAKGAFMIYGKRTHYQGLMDPSIGKLIDGKIMCGPHNAVLTHCKEYLLIKPGKDKPSDCAKKIAKILGAGVDEVLRVLPSGTCAVQSLK